MEHFLNTAFPLTWRSLAEWRLKFYPDLRVSSESGLYRVESDVYFEDTGDRVTVFGYFDHKEDSECPATRWLVAWESLNDYCKLDTEFRNYIEEVYPNRNTDIDEIYKNDHPNQNADIDGNL